MEGKSLFLIFFSILAFSPFSVSLTLPGRNLWLNFFSQSIQVSLRVAMELILPYNKKYPPRDGAGSKTFELSVINTAKLSSHSTF